MERIELFQNENVPKGNKEDSLLIIYILRILKKYSSPDNKLSSQDVMYYLREDYSIGILDKADAQRKKIRRHLDTLCEFYPGRCIKKEEGKTRNGHKWFYDVSRDKFAKEEGIVHETLSKEEIEFITDIIASSKIINSSSTISIVNKLLKKTKLSKEDRIARLRKIKNEEWPKSINKELLLIKKEIQLCIDDVRKMKFDYEDEKSILATPYGWGSDENGKYILIAKVDGEPEGKFSSYSLEKIHNIKKEDFNYSDFDDTYFDRSYGKPDDLSTESLFANIQIITTAIEEKKGIEFKYLSYVIRNSRVVVDGKEKRILPHRLVFNDGKYYLIGYDEEQAKIDYYRVDLISKLAYSNKKIEISDWDERVLSGVQRAREIEKHPLMLAGTDIPVTFKVAESGLNRVIDAFTVKPDKFDITEETMAVKDSSGKVFHEERLVKVQVKTTREEAFRWALANADVVELVHPQDIRDRLGRIADPIHKTYARTLVDRVRENIDYIRETGMFKITMNVDKDTAFETYKELKNQNKLDLVNKIHIGKIEGDPGDYFGDFKNAQYLNIRFAPNCKNLIWASNLTEIVRLDIHQTQIRDVSWLKVMENLKCVEITKTPICDLSVLKDHKHILLLNVSDTLITDISFIENYEHLGKLDVSGCPIEDYTPLLKIRPLDMLIIDEKAVNAIGMDNLVNHHPDAVIKVQQKIDNRKV